jgi:hypothetical protein
LSFAVAEAAGQYTHHMAAFTKFFNDIAAAKFIAADVMRGIQIGDDEDFH